MLSSDLCVNGIWMEFFITGRFCQHLSDINDVTSLSGLWEFGDTQILQRVSCEPDLPVIKNLHQTIPQVCSIITYITYMLIAYSRRRNISELAPLPSVIS